MASSGRHLARRNAVQALYQWDMTRQKASRIKPNFIFDTRLKGRYLEYFELLITKVPEKQLEIDRLIERYADRTIDKIDPIEKAILRIGTYELCFQPDMPATVVVNEAIELAKLFCAELGYKYVNGVLDKIVKQQNPNSA